MKKLYMLFFMISFLGYSQNVTITKIIETGCSSTDGFVKTVELYVDGTVDFSTEVTLNYMQNGDLWANNQIDISALGVQTDNFVYIVRDIPAMQDEFPSTTFDASNTVVVSTSTNGDDGYQVVLNGNVVSQFGRTETDADDDTESNWQHTDAVATRVSGVPDIGTWEPNDWVITPENDLDTQTDCQTGGATNLETYFNTLGGTFPLGSGSGWTPTGATCTTALGSSSVSCDTTGSGAIDDTYTATIDFSGANNGNNFVVMSSSGTVGGDSPTSVESGTIVISNIPEGTDITVTLSDIANGGVCDLSETIDSPGCVPLVINEVLFDPAADLPGDANGDGTRDALEDEFIELINNSGAALDISGYTISDAADLRHTFPPATIIPANEILVVFGGGTPTGSFGGSIVQTASEGQLNLSNGGDVITINNNLGDQVLVFDSGVIAASVSDNQSVTRDPDITGGFVLHTDAIASLLFSPGQLLPEALSVDSFEVSNIKIFPNPVSNGMVTIASENLANVDVEMYDILGKRVSDVVLNNNTLNVSQLTAGMYLLKISVTNGSSAIKKLVIH
ncbi:lamin tail domain-containing protein [Psychroserpens sp. BH13MA-6]